MANQAIRRLEYIEETNAQADFLDDLKCSIVKILSIIWQRRNHLVGVFGVYVVFDTLSTWLLEILWRYLDEIGDGSLSLDQRAVLWAMMCRGEFFRLGYVPV